MAVSVSLFCHWQLKNIIRKHCLKFRAVHICKGLPWGLVSSPLPEVFEQSLADHFEREASCTGEIYELDDLSF